MTLNSEQSIDLASPAGDFEHIHPNFRAVMYGSDQQRLDYLKHERWIGYQAASTALDTLKGLLDMPPQTRTRNLLLVSDSNNGKTTIAKRFRSLHGQGYVDENGDPVSPVIFAEAPPYADELGLYVSLLERFWAPFKATDKIANLRYQTIHQIRDCKVRLLIIDEIHSLLAGTARKQREVMNVIKLLCNETGVSIVGVGTRDAVRVLHTDPQLSSRFDVLPIPLWSLDAEFQKLLAGFERVLPLKQPSGLAEPEKAMRAHAISGGRLGDLWRLLQACAEMAITGGEERITMAILSKHSHFQPTKGVRHLAL